MSCGPGEVAVRAHDIVEIDSGPAPPRPHLTLPPPELSDMSELPKSTGPLPIRT